MSFVFALLLFYQTMDVSVLSFEKSEKDASLEGKKRYEILTGEKLPEVISDEESIKGQHIERIADEEENLYTMVFSNANGTKTAYIFDQPVKYVDSKGSIQDISTEVIPVLSERKQSESYAYQTRDNSVLTYYPKDICKNPVIVENEETTISMKPVLSKELLAKKSETTSMVGRKTELTIQQEKQDSIQYDDVFGEGMHLRYIPTYTGVKEDIILDAYTGVARFGFEVEAKSHYAERLEDGSIIFTKENREETVATLLPVAIYDSSKERRHVFGHYELKKNENGQYIIEVVVDEEFLKDTQTVYPVYVDPTITMSNSTQFADAMLYSGKPTQNQGSNVYHHVGYMDTSYGYGRLLLRFPTLATIFTANGITTAGQISSANLTLYNDLSSTASTVSVHNFTGATWTETGVTFSNAPASAYNTTSIASASMSTTSPTVFNITSAVRGWVSTPSSISKGLLLKNANETSTATKKVFYSREFGSTNAAYMPKLAITYTVSSGGSGGGSSFATATNLALGTQVAVSVSGLGEKRYFKYTPTSSGFYSFESSSVTNGDPVAYLYNSSQAQLQYDDDGQGFPNFRLVYHLKAGQTYYYTAGGIGASSYNIRLSLSHACNDVTLSTGVYSLRNISNSNVIDVKGPTAQEWVHQWNFHANIQARWKLQKQSDGYYTIRSEYGNKYYIGVSSTNTGTDISKLYTSISDNTRWKIYRNSSGELFLEPKLAPGKVLCVPNANIGAVLQLIRANSVPATGRWRGVEIKYSFTTNHYYDQGYDVRFSGSSSATTLISGYQRISSNIYLDVFGLGITSTISGYTSIVDTCAGLPMTLAKTKLSCSHTPNHRNRTQIKDNLLSQVGQGTNVMGRYAWTGHVLGSNSSAYFPNYAVVMAIGATTDSNYNNRPANVVRYESIYTLVHETGHQLGAPDHYCYAEGNNACSGRDCWRCRQGKNPPNCLMTYRYDDLEAKLNNGTIAERFCSQCRSTIHSMGFLVHLNDHHR